MSQTWLQRAASESAEDDSRDMEDWIWQGVLDMEWLG